MQANLVNTFKAYSGAVDQRYSGAAEAAKYGAVAVIVRSLNFRLDDYPHWSYGKHVRFTYPEKNSCCCN